MDISFSDKQKSLHKRRKRLLENPTSSEIRIKNLLESSGYRIMFQKGFIQGHNYVITDFYIPRLRLCLEVDGLYHLDPIQQKRDKQRDDYLINYRGFKVKHITNEVADSISLKELIEFITK